MILVRIEFICMIFLMLIIFVVGFFNCMLVVLVLLFVFLVLLFVFVKILIWIMFFFLNCVVLLGMKIFYRNEGL